MNKNLTVLLIIILVLIIVGGIVVWRLMPNKSNEPIDYSIPTNISNSSSKTNELTKADIQSEANSFSGKLQDIATDESLLQQYGRYSFETFQKHPGIVSSVKVLNSNFSSDDMATGFPSTVATFNDRTLVILEGCFPHNCGGTVQFVAIEPSTQAVYLFEPTNIGPTTTESGKFNVYGNPDDAIRSAMFNAYLQYLAQ